MRWVSADLGGTKRAAELGRSVPQTLDIGRKKIIDPISGGTKRAAELGRKPIISMILFSGFGVVELEFRTNKILFILYLRTHYLPQDALWYFLGVALKLWGINP